MTQPAAPLRVTVFAPLRHLTPESTGVGKHIIQMVRGLAAVPEMRVTMLAGRDELDPAGRIPAGNPLSGLPATALPASRRLFELSWKAFRRPRADRWCPGADWVYCPAEAIVPVRRARLAVTVHDLHAFETDLPWSNTPAHRRVRLRWRAMFRQVTRFAALYLAVSEFTKRRIVEILGVEPGRIRVVGNGVEDTFFSSATEPPAAPPYVLVVGGLTWRKGGDFVLGVADRLAAIRPEMSVFIAGASETEVADRAKARANVRQLGLVPAAELPDLVRRATALFFPSRYEGFGIPVLEAMAAGTPVVCSSAGALPEVAGDAAVYVGHEDETAAAEALLRLADDLPLRAAMIGRGRERAEQFRWSACIRRLVEALRAS
jgi:glycosyltransferase involved in cell wall biosynthesis